MLISTDPAHNLSDAFGQRFSKAPVQVKGFENLFAMEIDPADDEDEDDDAGGGGEDKQLLAGLAGAMPGIDEAMSFSNVMKLVQSMQFSVVVFDTAPTGHTLRFLQFPQLLSKTFGSLFEGAMGGLLTQMMGLMGGGTDAAGTRSKMDATQEVVKEVSRQFQDASLTTFVAVTIPEFLPLYETERLLQELAKFNMDARNIVVNQILDPVKAQTCEHCTAKSALQQRYLQQVDELYEGLFHITCLPAVTHEIRGVDALTEFSPMLLQNHTDKLKVPVTDDD